MDRNNIYTQNDDDINKYQKNKVPLLFILKNNSNERITNMKKIYSYNNLHNNKINDKRTIIELIKNVHVKIYFICKKSVNEEEYNNRYKILIKFNNLYKKFMKNKYENREIKDKHIQYTDISYNVHDQYIVSFYVVTSHVFGVFKNINNIFILMKEFNNILKNNKEIDFGKDFINLNIYNHNFCKNVFTFISSRSKKISVFNGDINNYGGIHNKYFFTNSLVGYYEDIKNIIILDNRTNTLDDYFEKLKISVSTRS